MFVISLLTDFIAICNIRDIGHAHCCSNILTRTNLVEAHRRMLLCDVLASFVCSQGLANRLSGHSLSFERHRIVRFFSS